jgi:hypothetical protein
LAFAINIFATAAPVDASELLPPVVLAAGFVRECRPKVASGLGFFVDKGSLLPLESVKVRLLGLFGLISTASSAATSALNPLLLVSGLPFFAAAVSAQSCLIKSFFMDVARLRILPR